MHADPQAPVKTTVPLHLLSYATDHTYDVSIGSEVCTTPCTLTVQPGPTFIKATGSGKLTLELVVPPRPGQIRLQHADGAGFYAGAALVPIGVVMASTLWAIGLTCNNSFDGNSSCMAGNFIAWPSLGLSVMITGIVLLARGHQVPEPDSNRVEIIGRRSAPVQLTSFGLAPLVGSSGAPTGLGFSF